MSLIYNATFDKNTRKLSFEDKAGNEIYSFIVPERGPAVDDITKPLTFKATQDGSTVTLTKKGSPAGDFQSSNDGGNTWTDYTLDSAISLNTGDEVSFRAKADRTTNQSNQNYFYFNMTGKIEAWHNIMSLYRTNDFATYESVVSYAFDYLFNGCTSLVKAPVLPATTLGERCYVGMFKDCTSLVNAPALPATTLANNCYQNMFYGCTSLVKAPELQATTLANSCYSSMFYGCTSLVNAPALPATTLANSCYNSMFNGCTSLVKAPVLPATTLGERCYSSMFYGCTSLVNAPALPATTLANSCYSNMFYGCTSLTEAPVLPATTLAESCYYGLFNGCTSLVNAPVLPATTLADSCYYGLFYGCTSLVKAPVLPATTLANSCYSNMFHGCTSLTNAPELQATTLDVYCYSSMFYGCTSLVNAPALPATTLANNCYYDLFNGCTSLVKAPELPATTLGERCYVGMFKGCSSLNEVRCKMPSTISTENIPKYTAHGFSGTSPWLDGVSSTGTFYTNADANWPSGASGIPEGWTRVNERAKDDITKPLTFKATQDGSTVTLKQNGSPTGAFQTSTDGGNTWSDYTLDSAITLNTGDEVSFRAKADRTTDQNGQNYFYFNMTGKIEAWHNIMSLYRTNDFATYNTAMKYGFYNLFKACTSLTKAPALPATTLANNCYYYMFQGCTSLTKAPALPATTLASSCYYYMFKGCTSLAESPELPATTLAQSCYSNMFNGCSSLNEVRCNMPSSYSSSDISTYTNSWLKNVSSTGTFYTNADANWPSGANGIPEGWTRVNEGAPTVDDITKPLTFKATQDGSTVKLTKSGSPSGDFQMSFDGGTNWVDYTIGNVTRLNIGDEVSFRAKTNRSTSLQTMQNYFRFEMTGKIEAWHNVMSLYIPNKFATSNSVVRYAFYSLFYGCTSLTKAPVLPATTLTINCYEYMFFRCTSLTKAPELPATTLADSCYTSMFSGCQSLKEVRIAATKTASRSLEEWLYGVSSTGDFYCDPNATIFPSGASGIPQNWTRHNIADYPTT